MTGLHPVRAARALLAERSRRGRIASWLLAAGAVLAAIAIVATFFPRRAPPHVFLSLAGRAAVAGPIAKPRLWPAMAFRVYGAGATAQSGVEFRLDSTRIGSVAATAAGRFDAVLAVPVDARPGRHTLIATDLGAQRQAARFTIVVVDGGAPGVLVQPSRPRVGAAVVLAGGGLPPAQPVSVVLDADGPAPRTLGHAHTRIQGLLVTVVKLPADVGRGRHTLTATTADGEALAAAALEVRR